MKKRILSLGVVLCMIVSMLCACQDVKQDMEQDVKRYTELDTEQYTEQDVKLVYMDELSPSNSDRYTGNEGDSFIDTIGKRNGNVDVNGNTYNHGLTAWVARWNYTDEISWVWNEYDINGEYEYLHGDIVLIKSYNENNFRTKIQIIGDGNILYEETLTPSNLPINDLKINVSNVDKLKISVKDLDSVSGGTAFGLADFRLINGEDMGDLKETDEDDLKTEEGKNPSYKTITYEIDESEIEEKISMNIQEWDFLSGITETMISTTDSAEDLISMPAWFESIDFLINWLNNSNKITKLNVTKGKNNTISIQYGEPLELNKSGKKTDLGMLIVEKYYNFSPSIVFNFDDKADEMLRSWFDLSGDGKYSMKLEFGKVYVGDCGYYLSIEDGKIYQVPKIHPDTSMKVYYKEGKNVTYMFDAADIFRNIKIELPNEDAEKVFKQLKDYGFDF